MNLQALIESIRQRGYSIHVVEGRLKLRGPEAPDNETQALIDELRRHRDEVKAMLIDDDPLLGPGGWYPEFHSYHESVVKETPNFDYILLRQRNPDLYREIKVKENEIDMLQGARLSEVMALVREWRGLILKADFEQRRAERKSA